MAFERHEAAMEEEAEAGVRREAAAKGPFELALKPPPAVSLETELVRVLLLLRLELKWLRPDLLAVSC